MKEVEALLYSQAIEYESFPAWNLTQADVLVKRKTKARDASAFVGVGKLDWATFSAGISDKCSNFSGMHKVFLGFVQMIKEQCDEMVTSEEVQLLTHLIYSKSILLQCKVNSIMKELPKNFVVKKMTSIIEAVTQLHEWRVQQLTPPLDSEYGVDIVVHPREKLAITSHVEEFKCEAVEIVYNSSWLESICKSKTNQVLDILSSSSDSMAEAKLFDLLGLDSLEYISAILLHKKDLLKGAVPTRLTFGIEWLTNLVGSDAERIVNLISSQNEATIQSTLFDICSDPEKCFEILQHRDELVASYTSMIGYDAGIDTTKGQSNNEKFRAPGNLFSITSESQKNYDKLAKKEQRQNIRRNFPDDLPDKKQVVFDKAKLDSQASIFTKGPLEYKAEAALPVGTERLHFPGYERVTIPPVIPHQQAMKLLVIKELPEIIQKCIKEETLNRIQTTCYPCAFGSNENMLVCAPTGAGKTNVALLTILRQISAGGDYKVVYVAPMKALAQEITGKFAARLSPLGINVRECTGDMQLSKTELESTHVIVTTPEKWDVITRKSGEGAMTASVKLLILDEVHLLHEDRGSVLEVIIARTLRLVESSQNMIRIVGLSATLPNYTDVGDFLRVNPNTGLFLFDASFRPVPLHQTYIGVTESNPMKRRNILNDICYERVKEALRSEYQVMVFVHSRKETVSTANFILTQLEYDGIAKMIDPKDDIEYSIKNSRNAELVQLLARGIGFHNAGIKGMLRSDRNIVEKEFMKGLVRYYRQVLVCTATLAWGVNLPCHTVIIKGTELYDPKAGGFTNIGMMDIMQIFGRAGRPQFDVSGEACIITTQDQMNRYLYLLNHALPIESTLISALPDHLNAEIISGSVTNLREAITWLTYTYLYVRLRKNPTAYGVPWEECQIDPELVSKRNSLVESAAVSLHKARMVRFDPNSGNFFPTDLGRAGSYFYLSTNTIEIFNEKMKPFMDDNAILDMISCSSEFEQIKFREEEGSELEKLKHSSCMHDVVAGDKSKTNVLLQVFISNSRIESFTLISDQLYIAQSAGRIARALFEIALKRGYTFLAGRLLEFCKMIDKRQWDFQHPLRQFPNMKAEWAKKLENTKPPLSVEKIRDMSAADIGVILGLNTSIGNDIKRLSNLLPIVELDSVVQPITNTILQINLTITCPFNFSSNVSEPYWIWVEDGDGEHVYHSEYVLLSRNNRDSPISMIFTVPVFNPPPAQYIVVAVSDRWLGCKTVHTMSFKHLIMPQSHPPTTTLLNLTPLPLEVLGNEDYQSLYKGKFTHFNPIQTQAFHTLYHTDHNVLLGAPTGSGKTITAELCMFRLFNNTPDAKIVYVAPLKALARERLLDWTTHLGKKLNKKVVELTGDFTPDIIALNNSNIIITTPEKWDGISRDWQHRNYVKKVGLVIIDEIHLLGTDRGPVLEVIVSRMRYIAAHTNSLIRIVGLSTALANASDLADWLGIKTFGLFNFPPSVRPVPLTVHISGFPGKHYCPRMATMNKPTYAAITTYSPNKPVLVFVSSRRQTRLTALDLISFTASDSNPRKWLKIDSDVLDCMTVDVQDEPLKHCLSFGVGIHHAGLNENDRKLVEKLFVEQSIQVLVATSTLAWGVNFPAHLVVVKGTEFYDTKTNRYVDYPITDVLQMMGRAGRPQFDSEGRACVLVHEPKKVFYRKFLYEPFPVESALHKKLHNHLNAEIVGGTITSLEDAIDYLSWTYYFRRLIQNPSYYSLSSNNPADIHIHLSALVKKIFDELEVAQCISSSNSKVAVTSLGKIASFYYLNYSTVKIFADKLSNEISIPELIVLVSSAAEFAELPVRHNEELMNEQLSSTCPFPVETGYESPHIKTNLLLQSHLSHLSLPISDYITDTKSVLDQTLRVFKAMVDIACEKKLLTAALLVMNVVQMIVQAHWIDESSLKILPGFTAEKEKHLSQILGITSSDECITISELLEYHEKHSSKTKGEFTKAGFSEKQATTAINVLQNLPLIDFKSNWPKVASPGSTFKVSVSIKSSRLSGSKSIRAYAPNFPKPKEEGYWIVLGTDTTVIECRSVSLLREEFKVEFNVVAPKNCGVYQYALYLMSDCYIGLDQEYSYNVEIK